MLTYNEYINTIVNRTIAMYSGQTIDAKFYWSSTESIEKYGGCFTAYYTSVAESDINYFNKLYGYKVRAVAVF